MYRLFLIILLCSPTWANSTRNNWDTVNICHLEWGKSTGAQLLNKGFYLNTAAAIFEHAGYKVTTHILPWKRCVAGVKNETMDMIAMAWLTEENIKGMISPTPLLSGYIAKNYFITSATHVENSEPQSLKGLRFGGPAKDSLPDFIQQDYVPQFSKQHVQATQTQSFKMLLLKRIDLVYSPLDTFLDFYQEQPADQLIDYKVLKPHFDGLPVAPLLKANSSKPERQAQLIKDYNQAYQALCLSGQLHNLLAEHHDKDGLLTHLQDPLLPDLLTHCTLIQQASVRQTLSVEALLQQSGHLSTPN